MPFRVSCKRTTRHGDYFFDGYGLTNTASPVFTTLTVFDGTTTLNLPAFLAKTAEPFTYDDDGNMTRDGRWVYVYDAENRLVTQFTRGAVDDPLATAPDNIAVWNSGVARQKLLYTYDYLGRRTSKTVANWNGTGSVWQPALSRKFVYDGWNLMAEFDALTTLTLAKTCLWGLDLSDSLQGAGGVGGLLLVQEGGNSYLPAYDAMGNVHGMIKASDGSLAAAYEYDAFGQTLRESGPYAATNPFRFATKYADTETGLIQYNTRYYSPTLGRFLNRDTISEQGGLNLYAYCGNSGVNGWDYLGMDWDDAESRYQAHLAELARYEAMMVVVNSVYGQPAQWDYVGYGSSISELASAAWADNSSTFRYFDAHIPGSRTYVQDGVTYVVTTNSGSIPVGATVLAHGSNYTESSNGNSVVLAYNPGSSGGPKYTAFDLPKLDISIADPKLKPIDVNVNPFAGLLDKALAEILAYAVNPEEVVIPTNPKPPPVEAAAWAVTNGVGGAKTFYPANFEQRVAEAGQDPGLIRIHEADHVTRLNAADLPQLRNAVADQPIQMLPGSRTQLMMEYMANQAAMNAARSMEQTTAVTNTLDAMRGQNVSFINAWIFLGPVRKK